LAELEAASLPERRLLRRTIRHELRRVHPSIRVFAEDLLTETTTADLVGRGASSELVVVRIGRNDEDERLLTSLLADCAWLGPRLEDWCKLAPQLDLDPDACVRGLPVCPDSRRETCSENSLLPQQKMQLLRYHWLPRQHGRLAVLLEPVKLDPPIQRCPSADPIPESDAFSTAEDGQPLPPTGKGLEPLAFDPSPAAEEGRSNTSCFRTGLTDADLHPISDPLTRVG